MAMIPTTYVAVLLLSFLSGLTTIVGVALAICCRKNLRLIVVGIGFATGIMLLISFLELIPESLIASGAPNTLIAMSLGILLVYSLDIIIPHTHLVKERPDVEVNALKTAYLVTVGLILHDFPEGFAMANSYIYSPALGILIALAVAIHNIPEEFAMCVPIVSLERGKKKFLYKAAFLSGLAEPAGAVVGLLAVNIMPSLTPLFMAFAAGAMIFVSFHELLPMAKRYRRMWLFVLGLILSIFAYLVLGLLLPE